MTHDIASRHREVVSDVARRHSERERTGRSCGRLIERDVVESTNDVAAELVRAKAVPLPLAVWAHRQTRGRGRGSQRWWSDAGSLTFTIAIDPGAHGLAPMHSTASGACDGGGGDRCAR